MSPIRNSGMTHASPRPKRHPDDVFDAILDMLGLQDARRWRRYPCQLRVLCLPVSLWQSRLEEMHLVDISVGGGKLRGQRPVEIGRFLNILGPGLPPRLRITHGRQLRCGQWEMGGEWQWHCSGTELQTILNQKSRMQSLTNLETMT